jgi:hypothetical protein
MGWVETWAGQSVAAYLALPGRRAGPFYLALGYDDLAVFYRKPSINSHRLGGRPVLFDSRRYDRIRAPMGAFRQLTGSGPLVWAARSGVQIARIVACLRRRPSPGVAVSESTNHPCRSARSPTSVSITVLPTPRGSVKSDRRAGDPAPSSSDSPNSSRASSRPTRSGGVDPAVGRNGFRNVTFVLLCKSDLTSRSDLQKVTNPGNTPCSANANASRRIRQSRSDRRSAAASPCARYWHGTIDTGTTGTGQ